MIAYAKRSTYIVVSRIVYAMQKQQYDAHIGGDENGLHLKCAKSQNSKYLPFARRTVLGIPSSNLNATQIKRPISVAHLD